MGGLPYEFSKGKTYLHCKTTSSKHPEKTVRIDPSKVWDIEYATYKYRGHYHKHLPIKTKALEKFYKSYADKHKVSLQQRIPNSRANLQNHMKQQKSNQMKMSQGKGLRMKP